MIGTILMRITQSIDPDFTIVMLQLDMASRIERGFPFWALERYYSALEVNVDTLGDWDRAFSYSRHSFHSN